MSPRVTIPIISSHFYNFCISWKNEKKFHRGILQTFRHKVHNYNFFSHTKKINPAITCNISLVPTSLTKCFTAIIFSSIIPPSHSLNCFIYACSLPMHKQTKQTALNSPRNFLTFAMFPRVLKIYRNTAHCSRNRRINTFVWVNIFPLNP